MQPETVYVQVDGAYVTLRNPSGGSIKIHRDQLDWVNRQMRAAENWLNTQRKALAALEGHGEPEEDGDSDPKCESEG